jgi:hypothetical protein
MPGELAWPFFIVALIGAIIWAVIDYISNLDESKTTKVMLSALFATIGLLLVAVVFIVLFWA